MGRFQLENVAVIQLSFHWTAEFELESLCFTFCSKIFIQQADEVVSVSFTSLQKDVRT